MNGSTITRITDLCGESCFNQLPSKMKDIIEAEAVADMLKHRTFLEAREDEILTCERRRYQERIGVTAAHIATIVRPENTTWMMERMRSRIEGKVVVEIGAGLGILAVEMARVAKRVFAIDSDPEFTASFVMSLYQDRPSNLTFIFDTAQGVLASGIAAAIDADVAVVVTGSDDDGMRQLARAFVREPSDVIMPWQDWNGGRAIIDYKGEKAPSEEPPKEPWIF